jgi:hypothetical protein
MRGWSMEIIEQIADVDLFGVHGVRVVLVGTTTYHHYKHGNINTEAIVVLESSLNRSGEVGAMLSVAGGASHSGRDQGQFKHASVLLPKTVKVGVQIVLKTRDGEEFEVKIASITV